MGKGLAGAGGRGGNGFSLRVDGVKGWAAGLVPGASEMMREEGEAVPALAMWAGCEARWLQRVEGTLR